MQNNKQQAAACMLHNAYNRSNQHHAYSTIQKYSSCSLMQQGAAVAPSQCFSQFKWMLKAKGGVEILITCTGRLNHIES
jgi:hypothetical protein